MTCTSAVGCAKPIQARGLCSSHYKTLRRFVGLVDGPAPVCDEGGCATPSESRGKCQTHYLKLRQSELQAKGQVCSTPGCGRGQSAKGLCKKCYGAGRYLLVSDRVCPVSKCGRSVVDSKTVCRTHRALASSYSLSVFDVIRMSEPENYFCQNMGCLSTEKLNIDHDHSCCDNPPNKGKQSCGSCVRGWLCPPCNRSLGALKDNPSIIRGLADYISRF